MTIKKQSDVRLRSLQAIHFINLYLASRQSARDRSTKPPPLPSSAPSSPFKLTRRATITAVPEFEDIQKSGEEIIDINNRRVLDSFMTIHLLQNHHEKLIYISDVQHQTMNPEFDTISLPSALLNYSDKIIIKLWSKPMFTIEDSNTGTEWHLLAVYRMNLASLMYFGDEKLIEDELLAIFKPNSILFKLNGGWYMLPNLLRIPQERLTSCLQTPTNHIQPIPSYSSDSIRSINNLNRSIREFTISKHKLSKQISQNIHVLQDPSNINNLPVFIGKLRSQCQSLANAISIQQSKNDELQSDIYQTKKRISELKQVISDKFEAIKETTVSQIELYDTEIESIRQSQTSSLYPHLVSQLQSVTKVIQDILPIENIDGLLFSIVGLQFPSDIKDLLNICYYNSKDLKNSYYQPTFPNESQWHSFKIGQINAGILFIAQIINLLASIANVQLKYEIILAGSHSLIVDHISTAYPLASGANPRPHIKAPYKFALCYNPYKIEKVTNNHSHHGKYILMNQEFEYALKLLNKNLVLLIDRITELCQRVYPGDINVDNNLVPVDCLDNFLWNLKYLMLFMTAPT